MGATALRGKVKGVGIMSLMRVPSSDGLDREIKIQNRVDYDGTTVDECALTIRNSAGDLATVFLNWDKATALATMLIDWTNK